MPLWPCSTPRDVPSWPSHNRIVWSKLPLASVPPSGLQARACTRSVCSSSVSRQRPLARSHSFRVPSQLVLLSWLPSGAKASPRTQLLCSESVCMQRAGRAGMRHLLKEGAQLRVPEPDGRIQSPTGEQAAIRSKSHAGGALRLPARPEQSTTVNFPELDAAIEAPAGQRAFVRAEGEAPDSVRV